MTAGPGRRWTGGVHVVGSRRITRRYPVANLYSISHLIPEGHRSGIYLLGFKDGQRYVGRSVDVVTRFSSHRRRWNDIVDLWFAEVPEEQQSVAERTVNHAQQRQGWDLRNVADSPGSLLGQSPLDTTVSLAEQDGWLSTGILPAGSGSRSVDETQRRRFAAQAAELASSPNGELVTMVLGWYVAVAFPRPAETERTFWTVTAMPATNKSKRSRRLATLTAHITEVAWVQEEVTTEGVEYLLFIFNVATSVLEAEAELTISQMNRKFSDCRVMRAPYAAGDVAGISFTDGDLLNGAPGPLPWQDAARALVLRSFRKGRTMQGRWHNYDFATAVLDAAANMTVGPNE